MIDERKTSEFQQFLLSSILKNKTEENSLLSEIAYNNVISGNISQPMFLSTRNLILVSYDTFIVPQVRATLKRRLFLEKEFIPNKYTKFAITIIDPKKSLVSRFLEIAANEDYSKEKYIKYIDKTTTFKQFLEITRTFPKIKRSTISNYIITNSFDYIISLDEIDSGQLSSWYNCFNFPLVADERLTFFFAKMPYALPLRDIDGIANWPISKVSNLLLYERPTINSFFAESKVLDRFNNIFSIDIQLYGHLKNGLR